MASTTDLGKWMLTNGGEYNPETAYEQLTMVMYENSTYITLKTVQGITPTDDHINYQLMAKGFNPTALASVQAEDTSGVLGEVGGTVSAQDLIDWVVDQAATKLLKISDLVSVQTNDATKGVSAALAYAMNQSIDQLDSNLNIKADAYCSDGDGATLKIPAKNSRDSFFLIGFKYDSSGAAVNIICGILSKTWESVARYASINGDSPDSVTFNKDTRQYEVYIKGFALITAINLFK